MHRRGIAEDETTAGVTGSGAVGNSATGAAAKAATAIVSCAAVVEGDPGPASTTIGAIAIRRAIAQDGTATLREAESGVSRRSAAGYCAHVSYQDPIPTVASSDAIRHDAIGSDINSVGARAGLSDRCAFDHLAGSATVNSVPGVAAHIAILGRAIVSQNNADATADDS